MPTPSSQIVPVHDADIGGETVQAVDGRELHQSLQDAFDHLGLKRVMEVATVGSIATLYAQASLQDDPSESLRSVLQVRDNPAFAPMFHDPAIGDTLRELEWAFIGATQSRIARHSHELRLAQPYFSANIGTLLPNAVLLNEKKLVGGLCDFLVMVDGEKRPVEVKRDVFDRAAMTQLRRYMNVYGSSHGYAAAPSIACELDSDMTFIELNFRIH